MFEIGDVVRMVNNHWSYDDRAIPNGALGIVVQRPADAEDYDEDEDEEQDNSDAAIGISWLEHHNTSYGEVYSRELFNRETGEWTEYNNVWFVSQDALEYAPPQEARNHNHHEVRIINKIKAIDEKVKNKRLKLRKVKPITFPDVRVA